MTTEMKPLPKRADVPQEMTWDLSVVYADEAAFDADFARIETMLAPFETMRESLTDSPQNLLHVLEASDEIQVAFGTLRAYASLRRSEDNGNPESQARYDRARMLGTRLGSALAFIEPQILAMKPEALRAFVESEPGLQLYDYYFETLERRRAHVRSAEVEDVLAQVSESMGGTSTVFTFFNNADLKFPPVRDENGDEQELTHGRYINFLESRERSVREDAFRKMHDEYGKWRNMLGASLSGSVKADVASARVRGYESALDAALQPDAIPTAVYRNLVSTVRERLPVLHRYLRLRKKLLKLDELQLWDLYVPMVEDSDAEMTYEESKAAVLDSFAPLGRDYVEATRGGFEKRWVDVMENEGKTSGAFSDGSYATPPYILMNWQDNLHKTFTLAHELGHSLHSYLARETQPPIYSGYTIFVAEVASTLNEALLTHYLVEKAKSEGNRELQLYLLNNQAEGFRGTLYRQTMFAEFELKIHEILERGEGLTADGMSEMYLQLNQDFYGAEVNVDPIVAIEWARIPHFYYGFYVYQYATGISAAAALSKQVLEEGAPAVERYLNFLRGGGSKTSIDLLKGAGVDMTSPTPIHQALDVFDSVVAQMEELSEAQ